jgi:hypothetical protein
MKSELMLELLLMNGPAHVGLTSQPPLVKSGTAVCRIMRELN